MPFGSIDWGLLLFKSSFLFHEGFLLNFCRFLLLFPFFLSLGAPVVHMLASYFLFSMCIILTLSAFTLCNPCGFSQTQPSYHSFSFQQYSFNILLSFLWFYSFTQFLSLGLFTLPLFYLYFDLLFLEFHSLLSFFWKHSFFGGKILFPGVFLWKGAFLFFFSCACVFIFLH